MVEEPSLTLKHLPLNHVCKIGLKWRVWDDLVTRKDQYSGMKAPAREPREEAAIDSMITTFLPYLSLQKHNLMKVKGTVPRNFRLEVFTWISFPQEPVVHIDLR